MSWYQRRMGFNVIVTKCVARSAPDRNGRSLPAFIAATMLVAMTLSGCSEGTKAVQRLALRKQALKLCETITHQSGKSCGLEVERKFSECVRPLLAEEISFEGYAECLGFVLPGGSVGSPVVNGK
jgi:hypothetical protein